MNDGSSALLLTLIRQVLRRGVLSDMDVEAMAADLEREGCADAAHSLRVCYIEACAQVMADGGNE